MCRNNIDFAQQPDFIALYVSSFSRFFASNFFGVHACVKHQNHRYNNVVFARKYTVNIQRYSRRCLQFARVSGSNLKNMVNNWNSQVTNVQ